MNGSSWFLIHILHITHYQSPSYTFSSCYSWCISVFIISSSAPNWRISNCLRRRPVRCTAPGRSAHLYCYLGCDDSSYTSCEGRRPPCDTIRYDTIGKGSPYSTAERRVPELSPVLGSQPAGDVSHKPGGRLPFFPPGLPLPSQSLRGLLPVLLLGEQRHNGTKTVARQRRDCDLNPGPFCARVQHANS